MPRPMIMIASLGCLQWAGLTAKLTTMVRPFTLRDLALVRRLSEQGVSLHAESALADNLHPLRGALLNMVVRSECPTLIWKSEDREQAGFIQLLLEEDRQHAHILYLSPQLDAYPIPADSQEKGGARMPGNVDLWLSLLDQAVAEVGKYGVQSLVAEVSETGPELPILRRAGFAVYTRQDIWALESDEPGLPNGRATHTLRPRLPKDDWDVQLLYANTVPRLVQLVEPAPAMAAGSTWVQRDDNDELVAFVHIHAGEVATWMRFYIHPSAESDAEEILNAALLVKGKQWPKPVYLCVRRYEGWLPAVLQRAGFQKWGSQAILVKHTVHHSQTKMPARTTGIEKAGIPVSTPYSQSVSSQPSAHSGPVVTGASGPEQERSARTPALNN